jgi:hypothetical protein
MDGTLQVFKAVSALCLIVGVSSQVNAQSGDNLQHVIVATKNGDVNEIYFKGGGEPIGQGTLGHFCTPPNGVTGMVLCDVGDTVAVAGYFAPSDGFQHVIVATKNGDVNEIYFKGGGQPIKQHKLAHFDDQIKGIAGYFATSDGFQHVIVTTNSGDVNEVFFKGGEQPIGQDKLFSFCSTTRSSGFRGPCTGQTVAVAGYLGLADNLVAGSGANTPTSNRKPMDLVWEQVDDNGLPLNPLWQYQATHQQPGIETGSSNTVGCGKPGEPCPYPDVPKLCDVSSTDLFNCASQQVTSNTEPNTWVNGGCNWSGLSPIFASGLFDGHKNWFPVTVTGALVLDAGYDDSWASQQTIGWDADMDFYLRPSVPAMGPEGRGLTLSSVLDKQASIGPEWDGYEVLFDQGASDSWWNRFFKHRNTKADSSDTAKKMVDPTAGGGMQLPPDDSVVIGMLSLDCRHFCHTELHPTYAMAIHTKASRDDDRWSVFARNWGNEGSCGNSQVEVMMQSFSIQLRHPYATAVTISSNYFVGRAGRYDQGVTILSAPTVGWGIASSVVNSGTPEAAAILTMTLPPPNARAVMLGELALTWTESSPTTTRTAMAAHWQPLQAKESPRDDEHLDALFKRMTPAQRRVFLANAPKQSKAPAPQIAKPIPQSPNLRPVKVESINRIVRYTPDPARAEQNRQLNQAFCIAYNGKLPGLPNACSTPK